MFLAMLTWLLTMKARIRELEKARWKSAWLTGVLSAVVTSALVALILRALG